MTTLPLASPYIHVSWVPVPSLGVNTRIRMGDQPVAPTEIPLTPSLSDSAELVAGPFGGEGARGNGPNLFLPSAGSVM